MGKTIRTIIVLLAAVMLLAGCDPKMGNQGGDGTQNGVTINGIYFPPADPDAVYVENPTEEEKGLLRDVYKAENDLIGKYLAKDEALMALVDDIHPLETDANDFEYWQFALKDGKTYTINGIEFTKYETRHVRNYRETDVPESLRNYTVCEFSKDGGPKREYVFNLQNCLPDHSWGVNQTRMDQKNYKWPY